MNYTCPKCYSDKLRNISIDKSTANTKISPIYSCDSCKAEFLQFCGVPYFGGFYKEDLFSVMEITSFLHSVHIDDEGKPVRKSGGKNQLDNFRKVRKLLDEVCLHGEENIVYENFGFNERPKWLDARLNGHRQFEQTIRNIDFRDKTVLDIGAGVGFDACWLYDLGAKITCLEYNPLQVALANSDFPQFQWLGATVENIPFADETFDFVVANHALHHVLHLESAIEEMLRVLKVGGYMLTVADSYSPNNFTENDEVKLFNNHPAVLRGVNEQTPQLYKFINALQREKDSIDATILTPIVHGIHERKEEMQSWSLDEADAILSKHNGGICMKVKKINHTESNKQFKKAELIKFEDYLQSLTSRTKALTKLAESMPPWALDLPINDRKYPKFRLLLGWQRQKKREHFRRIKSEAHLFTTRKYLISTINKLIIATLYDSKLTQAKFFILINGNVVFTKNCYPGMPLKVGIDKNSLKNIICDVNLLTLKIKSNDTSMPNEVFMVYEASLISRLKQALYIIKKKL